MFARFVGLFFLLKKFLLLILISASYLIAHPYDSLFILLLA